MIEVHDIEDHFVSQIVSYSGIGCCIENVIDKARQFGMTDLKRTSKMRDKGTTTINHSKIEWTTLR